MDKGDIVAIFILIAVFTPICLFFGLEEFGPLEQKQISGHLGERYSYMSNGWVVDASFESDGGARYRIDSMDVVWFIGTNGSYNLYQYLQDATTHRSINVTLRKTLFDKKIVSVEGFVPPPPIEYKKCSDCGGIFS